MTTSPQSAIAALRRSHEQLSAIVKPLTSDQLRGPSYASEWTIAQVLSHLGSGAEIGRLVLDAAVAGRPGPEREAFTAIWDVWNAKSADAQAADAMPADQTLVEAYEALDAVQLDQLRIPFGPMQLDAPGMARMRLGEHSVHTWDVAVTLDPTTTVDSVAVTELLDGLGFLAGFAGKPNGQALRVHVSTSGLHRDLVLDVGETVTLSAWDGAESLPRLKMPAEAFLRLVYGRLDAEHTPTVVEATGVSLDQLRAIFPGF